MVLPCSFSDNFTLLHASSCSLSAFLKRTCYDVSFLCRIFDMFVTVPAVDKILTDKARRAGPSAAAELLVGYSMYACCFSIPHYFPRRSMFTQHSSVSICSAVTAEHSCYGLRKSLSYRPFLYNLSHP